MIYNENLKNKKRILKLVREKSKKYKMNILISLCLFLISTSMIIADIFLINFKSLAINKEFLINLAYICVPYILLMASFCIRKKAKFKYAFPYSNRMDASLIIKEDYIEYHFWDIKPDECVMGHNKKRHFSKRKRVYETFFRIDKTNIESISFNDSVCTIYGSGFTHYFGTKKFMSVLKPFKSFSFVFAFNEDAFVSLTDAVPEALRCSA